MFFLLFLKSLQISYLCPIYFLVMMKFFSRFFRKTVMILMAIGVALLLMNASATQPEAPQTDCTHSYNVYALELPQNADFAGEKVPLQQADIRERFDRELLVNTYWQSNGFLLIKRANKYFPVIEKILRKNGVPDDFKYLALIESGLQNVVSPAGAAGFWQFMKTTGKEYGLEIEPTVDERYHLEKATEAACKYLKNAKQEMGSWTLAVAAYNAGKTGIRSRLQEQKVNNYYDLYLREETSRYVFRILALKEIMKDPKRYGFNFSEAELYHPEPFREISVDSTIADLPSFALSQGTNYKLLRLHNPWIRDVRLENKKRKKYTLKIPLKK